MEIRVVFFLIMLFQLNLRCQDFQVNNSNEIIEFTYDTQVYYQFASDTIKEIYLAQATQKEHKIYGISSYYNFEDLEIVSIPSYRLTKSACNYECDDFIEDFINFSDSTKYQLVNVFHHGRQMKGYFFPEPYFVMEKELNLKPGTIIDQTNYRRELIELFQEVQHTEQNILDFRPNSKEFYFYIYGIWDAVFKIDNKTNLVYAYFEEYNGSFIGIRTLPINDYVKTHIGKEMIREISKGYVTDFYRLPGTEEPCKVTSKKGKLVKVITK